VSGPMSTPANLSKAALVVFVALFGCDKEQAAPKPEPAKSSAPPIPTPAPSPVASQAPPEPKHDCPEGSTGVGSFEKPCEATGPERMMEVTWTGKTGDTGPSFRVVNKSKLVILYGKLATYFYDKKGKQLEVAGGPPDKPKMHQDCPGNIFGGVMNPGEKAVITFSCVGKQNVPEGTDAIEGEIKMVGFADTEGKHSDFYWKNDEIAPDTRSKGGLKAAPAKKK
jgi:hypothetical protein